MKPVHTAVFSGSAQTPLNQEPHARGRPTRLWCPRRGPEHRWSSPPKSGACTSRSQMKAPQSANVAQRRVGWAAATALVIGLTAGCRGLRGHDRVVFAVSVHRLARGLQSSTRLIQELPTEAGKTVRVYRFPLLWSGHFPSVRLVQTDEGGPALAAQLDRHGRFVWMRVTAEHGGEYAAVAVDGQYRFCLQIPRTASDESSVLLRGPWDVGEAEAIAEHSRQNYRELHSQEGR